MLETHTTRVQQKETDMTTTTITLTTTEGPLVANITVTRNAFGEPVHVFVEPVRRPRGWSYDECVRAMQCAVRDGRVRA